MKDKGLVTMDNFKKTIGMFFQDARLSADEIEFVIKMTPKTVDQ